MPVITIRGQTGSGAPEIGKEVARIIHGDYVDRQVLEQVAEMVGRSADEIDSKEQLSEGIMPRIFAAIKKALERPDEGGKTQIRTVDGPLDDEQYLAALEAVIQELAMEDDVVLVGRGSQFILSKSKSVLHVLVIAPYNVRVERIMALFDKDKDEAQKYIEERDSNRKAFIQRFFKRDLENPDNYDLVINTLNLSDDIAARIIVNAAEEKTPWTHG